MTLKQEMTCFGHVLLIISLKHKWGCDTIKTKHHNSASSWVWIYRCIIPLFHRHLFLNSIVLKLHILYWTSQTELFSAWDHLESFMRNDDPDIFSLSVITRPLLSALSQWRQVQWSSAAKIIMRWATIDVHVVISVIFKISVRLEGSCDFTSRWNLHGLRLTKPQPTNIQVETWSKSVYCAKADISIHQWAFRHTEHTMNQQLI